MQDFKEFSAAEIISILGTRYKDYRMSAELTQSEAAEKAGVSVPTLRKFERGLATDISFANVINLLRVVGLIRELNGLIPEMPINPYLISEIEGRKKTRVRHKTR